MTHICLGGANGCPVSLILLVAELLVSVTSIQWWLDGGEVVSVEVLSKTPR